MLVMYGLSRLSSVIPVMCGLCTLMLVMYGLSNLISVVPIMCYSYLQMLLMVVGPCQ